MKSSIASLCLAASFAFLPFSPAQADGYSGCTGNNTERWISGCTAILEGDARETGENRAGARLLGGDSAEHSDRIGRKEGTCVWHNNAGALFA